MSVTGKEAKAISKSYEAFQAQLKETQKLQSKLDEALLAYKTELDALATLTSDTEILFDAVLATTTGGSKILLNATKQIQETQMSFNLQYLQLQSQMQHENRTYTAVSNVMKTKHDTVKNSISNVH